MFNTETISMPKRDAELVKWLARVDQTERRWMLGEAGPFKASELLRELLMGGAHPGLSGRRIEIRELGDLD